MVAGLKEANLTNPNSKRVLWLSNAPWLPTGYGNQTALFVSTIPAYGHEVAVAANAGLRGTKMDLGIVKVYPGGSETYSNDVILGYAHDFGADVIISLYDAWASTFAQLPIHDVPWVAWSPIDHQTVPPKVERALRFAQGIVSFSKHGVVQLRNVGLEAEYIPHGIDTRIYTPGDQQASRVAMDLPPDVFLIGMVANNAYYPSRKAIPQVMAAFADFHARHPDSHLYLHMAMDQSRQGVPVLEIAKALGIENHMSLPNHFDFLMGYPFAAMANLYRSFDILVNPSLGEGFGIPIIEAQACGVPVVANRASSMVELVEQTGWLTEGDLWWSQAGAFAVMPHVGSISQRFEEAYREWKQEPAAWAERKERCREFAASNYDWHRNVVPLWNEYLNGASWSEPPGRQKQGECTCINVTAGDDDRRQYAPLNGCEIHDKPWQGEWMGERVAQTADWKRLETT